MLNNLGQVQIDLAGSRTDKIFITLKSLGKLLMLKQAVIHYIGGGYQSPNPQEIHCFKWGYCV